MLKRLELSNEHASWLEAERKIPCELAAELGVVSKGKDIAFEYRQNGAPSFVKVRKEIIEDGESSKTFWIEPAGVPLRLLERGLSQRTVGRAVDHHGGRVRRVVVPGRGSDARGVRP